MMCRRGSFLTALAVIFAPALLSNTLIIAGQKTCDIIPCRWGLFFFSSRRRHTRYWRDWSSDVCSSDLREQVAGVEAVARPVAQAGRHVREDLRDLVRGAGHRRAGTGGVLDEQARPLAGRLAGREGVVEGERVALGGGRFHYKKKSRELI